MATFNLIVYILQHDLWEGLIKEAVIDILKYVTDVLLCMLLLFSEVWFSFVLSLNNLNMVYCPACSFTKIGDPPIGLIEKYHKLFMPGILYYPAGTTTLTQRSHINVETNWLKYGCVWKLYWRCGFNVDMRLILIHERLSNQKNIQMEKKTERWFNVEMATIFERWSFDHMSTLIQRRNGDRYSTLKLRRCINIEIWLHYVMTNIQPYFNVLCLLGKNKLT